MKTNIATRIQNFIDDLRATGLQPVQIWVPDTRRIGFADECRRQSMSLAGDVQDKNTLEWFGVVADADGWK